MPTFDELTGILLDQELHSADSTTLFTSTRRAQAVNDGQAEFAIGGGGGSVIIND